MSVSVVLSVSVSANVIATASAPRANVSVSVRGVCLVPCGFFAPTISWGITVRSHTKSAPKCSQRRLGVTSPKPALANT